MNALNMPGGIISALSYISKEYGIILKVEKSDMLELPPYEGSISLKYTQVRE